MIQYAIISISYWKFWCEWLGGGGGAIYSMHQKHDRGFKITSNK